MGCSANFFSHSTSGKETIKKEGYTIHITDPNTHESNEFFLPEKENPELVMNIMNKLCFGKASSSNILDGNFISIYNEKDNRFHYYVHRLKGIQIEDAREPLQGKMWVCYINKVKQDWDLLVENDVKVSQKDIISWKYEKFKN